MAGMRNRSSRNGKNRGGRQNGSKRNHHSNNVINVAAARANYEKYIDKAKESRASGDRVSAENYLQFADHYKRILIEAEERKESMQASAEENTKTEETTDNQPQQLENSDNSGDIIIDRQNSIPQELLIESNAT